MQKYATSVEVLMISSKNVHKERVNQGKMAGLEKIKMNQIHCVLDDYQEDRCNYEKSIDIYEKSSNNDEEEEDEDNNQSLLAKNEELIEDISIDA